MGGGGRSEPCASQWPSEVLRNFHKSDSLHILGRNVKEIFKIGAVRFSDVEVFRMGS